MRKQRFVLWDLGLGKVAYEGAHDNAAEALRTFLQDPTSCAIALALSGADLSGADLRGIRVRCLSLLHCVLRGADFSGADLPYFRADESRCEGARFANANLQYASFSGANLQNADFRGANLEGAVFRLADLEGADFRGSNLEGAHFYLATHRAPERAIASRYPRTRTIRI